MKRTLNKAGRKFFAELMEIPTKDLILRPEKYQPRLEKHASKRAHKIRKAMKADNVTEHRDPITVARVRGGKYEVLEGFGRSTQYLEDGKDTIWAWVLPLKTSTEDRILIAKTSNLSNVEEAYLDDKSRETTIVELVRDLQLLTVKEASEIFSRSEVQINNMLKRASNKQKVEKNTSRCNYQPFKETGASKFVVSLFESLYGHKMVGTAKEKLECTKTFCRDGFGVNLAVMARRDVDKLALEWLLAQQEGRSTQFLLLVYGTGSVPLRDNEFEAGVSRLKKAMGEDLTVVFLSDPSKPGGLPVDSATITRCLEGQLCHN